MPRWAHEGDRRGPLAALLILVGLLFSAGSVSAAGTSVRDASARLGQARSGSASASVRTSEWSILSDESGAPDTDSFVPPSPPRLVVEPLAQRPSNQPEPGGTDGHHKKTAAAYRARAPPAA